MPVSDPVASGRIGGLTKEANRAVQRLIAARIEQGLPPLVVDPAALYAIAQAIALLPAEPAQEV